MLKYAREIIQASKDVAVGCRWYLSRFRGSKCSQNFEMAIRHKRRTTRTELERVFCLPLDLFSLTFTIILGPLGWGAILPMPPPLMDPPLSRIWRWIKKRWRSWVYPNSSQCCNFLHSYIIIGSYVNTSLDTWIRSETDVREIQLVRCKRSYCFARVWKLSSAQFSSAKFPWSERSLT